MVCLMKAPGRILVIGATQASISILSEITDPTEIERILGAAEAASPKGASAAFRELLGSVTGAQKRTVPVTTLPLPSTTFRRDLLTFQKEWTSPAWAMIK